VKIDDPIADALLGDSTYQRVRAERWGWFKQPIPKKLAWQSYLLFALAAVLPLTAALPAGVRESPLSDVASTSPKIALLAMVAAVLVAATGLGHAGVGLRRFSLEPSLTEVQALELFNLESLCSLVGFLTGGFATLVTYVFLLVGFGGVEALETYVAAGGGNPFATSTLGVDVASVAVFAMVGAVVLRLLSTYLYVESLRLELGLVATGTESA
jgi:hypothetical protein